MSKNDIAWKKFFDDTDVQEEIERTGYAYIQAGDLKRITGREPRLMAKQDTLKSRPEIFQDHDIVIFPVRNGQYILFPDRDDKSYFKFSQSDLEILPELYQPQTDLHAYDAYPGNQSMNESQAIDFAYISSLLKAFTGEESLFLTIRGRMYSGGFNLSLPDTEHTAEITGVQIEVDAGYESKDAIYLIEAKTGKRTDFHIRQLYYPYLEWSRRSSKKIIPIFLFYSNAKYYFYEFEFSDHFGDWKLVRSKCYAVNESPIAPIDLYSLADNITIPEPDVPYPQANDVDKVIDLISFVGMGFNTKEELAQQFDFDDRQGDYYANAARYLGFLEKDDIEFKLTDLGKKFFDIDSSSNRTSLLIQQLFQYPTFRGVLRLLVGSDLQLDSIPTGKIATIIEEYTQLSGSTPLRRASTVRSWMKWVLAHTDNGAVRDR